MKTHYAISIPKPCHEDWSKMSKNEKGRFCKSCCKTVVDFTKMEEQSIQNYLTINGNKKICGRFKVSQLEHIRIEIPQQIIQQQLSFHKLFLLALLIAMGTSLLNCSDQNGKTKKIDAVKIVDTLKPKLIHIPETLTPSIKIDSIKPQINEKKPDLVKIIKATIPHIMGDVIEVKPSDVKPIDLEELENEIEDSEEEIVVGHVIEEIAEFKNTPDSLSKSEKREYLSKHVSTIVSENFNLKIARKLGLKGKQRIYTQFKIDENGYVKDIKVRKSYHLELEKEAIRVINLLPQFKPAKQRNKDVSAIYTLPIVIMIED